MAKRYKRHYIKFLWRLLYLGLVKKSDCGGLVSKSYDRISIDYDDSWTNHMRGLTEWLINSLVISQGANCLDLTCGTGYASSLLAGRTSGKVTGVDKSEGMLNIARGNYGDRCEFIHSDILAYLQGCQSESFDIVTCCWGLGYSRPSVVMRQIKRVLRPGGQVAIIDNSLFSLKEILFCSFLTFAESPEKLANLMRFRFLPGSMTAAGLMRLAGLKVRQRNDGEKRYTVRSGQEAIARLRATGAAAGFEYAASDADSQVVFGRFAEIIDEKYNKGQGIDIIHRYLLITGEKC